MNTIDNLRIFNARGQSVLYTDRLEGQYHGRSVSYKWSVNTKNYEYLIPKHEFLFLLPDASGFIVFEDDYKPDNCLLLDIYGAKRMRLTVPWEMTGCTDPASGLAPTHFQHPSGSYRHPTTGEMGLYGVKAYVEGFHFQAFHFELDYHTGKFLWCYCLQRG